MTSPCQTCGAAFEPCYCNAPVVCPGCYSVGDEPCAVGCIDDEMRREADDFGDDDSCIRDDSTECDCSRCCEDQARWESWQGWDIDDRGILRIARWAETHTFEFIAFGLVALVLASCVAHYGFGVAWPVVGEMGRPIR